MTITAALTAAVPRAALAPAVRSSHDLGGSARLALLRRLAGGEAQVVDPVAELGLAQSAVSAHRVCLWDCGLVDFRPRGRASVCSPTHPESLDLVATAETLLAATGDAVARCPGLDTSRPQLRCTTPAETHLVAELRGQRRTAMVFGVLGLATVVLVHEVVEVVVIANGVPAGRTKPLTSVSTAPAPVPAELTGAVR